MPVLLWLQQAFRIRDNPALDRALALARRAGGGLVVLHGLAPDHPFGSPRVNRFLMESAVETMRDLERRGALVRHVRASDARPLAETVARYAREAKVDAVVTDDPLVYAPGANARRAAPLLAEAGVVFERVEANVVVPTRSYGKAAVGAYAIRSHLWREAGPRLRPRVKRPPSRFPRADAAEPPGVEPGRVRPAAYAKGTPHPEAKDVPWPAGERAARKALARFLRDGLSTYGERGEARWGGHHSRLSPYLHFGCLSPREVVKRALEAPAPKARRDAFVEQVLVRRELAFNAARFLPSLRTLDVLPPWARATLARHDGDERERVYTARELARADTHEDVWNATQLELRHAGTIHPYMRMYWAKRIVDWTSSHAHARKVMEDLNGAWAVDGRSPVMWTSHLWTFGLHDRPFRERPVTGKLRWMSPDGVRRKFDADAYVAWCRAGCPPRD